jgi:EAL domain-containing protein (putative c-di-GMP-specific phosphodiesterase class I)
MRFRAALDAVLGGVLLPQMHFQPVVDLRRACVVGYEALVRFPTPPILSTSEWFKNAANRGKRLSLEAISAALAMEFRGSLPVDTFLTVNMSPDYLLSEEGTALLDAQGDLSRLVIEITEDDRVHDYPSLRYRLDSIRDRGGSIAVDDTGAGYASLQHVMELRPQFVKLDRFFIENCHAEPAKSAMIQMIGEAADRIDAWVVAEGIETEPELHEVLRHTVPLGQGYYLGEPASEMLPMSSEAAASLAAAAEWTTPGGLHHCMEGSLPSRSLPEAEAAVRDSIHDQIATVLDEWDRPLHLVEKHPLLGIRAVPNAMRVQVLSHPVDLLRRALSRPQALRFDPIAVIGERGELRGIVRIERLIQSALSKA